MITQAILILVLLLFAFFFAVMEVAFVSANKLRIELDKKQNSHFSQMIEMYIEKPAQYYSTMAIGNLLVVVSLAIVVAGQNDVWQMLPLNAFVIIAVQMAVACLLYLLADEILPKMLTFHESGNLLKVISVPVALFYYMFYFLSKITYHISRFVSNRLTSKKINGDDAVYWGAVNWDLLADDMVAETSEDDESHDVKLFRNALDFSDVKLRECMVPRPEIVGISIDESIDELKKLFISSGLSKIMVYKGSIDNVVGFAPSISMFQHPANIAAITRNLPIVPETMPANKLLTLFIQNHRSIALVVDEFGGTSGIVTMEDILEEIVGDIQDEHDKKRYREHRFNNSHFQFSARLEIDYINDKYDLDLPVSEEYETLAGLILSHYGAIPKVQDVVSFGKFRFTILRASATKIELVDLIVS